MYVTDYIVYTDARRLLRHYARHAFDLRVRRMVIEPRREHVRVDPGLGVKNAAVRGAGAAAMRAESVWLIVVGENLLVFEGVAHEDGFGSLLGWPCIYNKIFSRKLARNCMHTYRFSQFDPFLHPLHEGIVRRGYQLMPPNHILVEGSLLLENLDRLLRLNFLNIGFVLIASRGQYTVCACCDDA